MHKRQTGIPLSPLRNLGDLWVAFCRFLRNGLAVFCLLALVACNGGHSHLLPKALKLKKPIYEVKVEHFFGPTGINQSFYVYKLSPETGAKITSEGFEFLNNLELRGRTDFEDPIRFGQWEQTPVVLDKNWLHWRSDKNKDTSPVKLFFGKDEFFEQLEVEHVALADSLISTEGNYYARGGIYNMSVLILSPNTGKAVLLYRG